MQEILPGVWHWAAPHHSLGGKPVSSYWIEDGGVLIDPLVPAEAGVEWFGGRPTPPRAIVLSNRHHYRDSGAFRERFGCEVHVPASGAHAFADHRPVIEYDYGQELPGGLRTIHVGALSPDEGGLVRAQSQTLWLADTVVRGYDPPGQIGWVLETLMDDPPQTRRALLSAYERLLAEVQFEHLLLAHGLPLVGDGRTELERLVAEGGRTASEAFA
ncbi:MAG: MBL fold metallo-hydrolase [Solirubrobacteraceae bacterium]